MIISVVIKWKQKIPHRRNVSRIHQKKRSKRQNMYHTQIHVWSHFLVFYIHFKKKSVGIKLVLYAQFSPVIEMMWSCQCLLNASKIIWLVGLGRRYFCMSLEKMKPIILSSYLLVLSWNQSYYHFINSFTCFSCNIVIISIFVTMLCFFLSTISKELLHITIDVSVHSKIKQI